MMSRSTDFPSTTISKDPDEANYQNYLAWQRQTTKRRRESLSHFNRFQYKAAERMSNQAQYKEESLRESEQLKDIIESRLSQACDCGNCGAGCRSTRSNSQSSSDSDGASSPRTSLSSLSSTTLPGKTVRGPTSPSSKNSLIVSPPPRSRHHQRRRNSLPPS